MNSDFISYNDLTAREEAKNEKLPSFTKMYT